MPQVKSKLKAAVRERMAKTGESYCAALDNIRREGAPLGAISHIGGAIFNHAEGEMTLSIVYCGPNGSGKTANLEYIHGKTPDRNRAEAMCRLSVQGGQGQALPYERLDLLSSVNVGVVLGNQVRLRLLTMPADWSPTVAGGKGLVLPEFSCLSAIVFVADARAECLEDNLKAFQKLQADIKAMGCALDQVPLCFQWNKRDLADVAAEEALEAKLNTYGKPSLAASASTGVGVLECLKQAVILAIAGVRDRHAEDPALFAPAIRRTPRLVVRD